MPSVGKTAILSFIKNGEIGRIYPTFGINYDSVNFKDFNLNFYDLSGKEEYRPYWGSIIRKSDLVIFVVDALDLTKVKENREALKNCIEFLPPTIPLVIFLNKTEQTRALTKKEIIELYELDELTKKDLKWNIFEVSALTGMGIPGAFKWIFKNLTNKEIEIGISLSEIIIFDENGSILYNKNNLFHENSDINLTTGFVLAVYKFAKETVNEKLSKVTIGPYKLMIDYLNGLIGVIIVHNDDSEEKALEVLRQILDKVSLENKPIIESEINKFIANNLLSYLFF